MRFLKLILVSLSFFLLRMDIHAQSIVVKGQKSTATLMTAVDSVQPGHPFWALLQIDLEPGWHTYWINPGDAGMATQIEWILPPDFSSSTIKWQLPQIFKEKTTTTYGFEGRALYLVKITPSALLEQNPNVTLKAQANWLVCRESCLPESANFTLTLPISPVRPSASAPVVQKAVETLPQLLSAKTTYQLSKNTISIFFPPDIIPKDVKSVQFLSMQQGVIKHTAQQVLSPQGNGYSLKIDRGTAELKPVLKGLLYIEHTQNPLRVFKVDIHRDALAIAESDDQILWHILLFAILGGIILNMMPCVFPILSLKAISVVQKKDANPYFIGRQGLFYTLGVLCCFTVLAGLLVSLRHAGQAIGWGFQMQSPVFVGLMIYLMFLIGLSLSGFFYLPVLFGSTAVIGGGENQSSVKASFWIGVLAVLVATPCTAPFMGVAIGYSLSQPIVVIFSVFVMLGLGFALPYVLICQFPQLLRRLPKPGPWMETLKQFMAFPMYATVIWLIWVLLQQSGSAGFLMIGSGLVLVTFCTWIWQQLSLEQLIWKNLTFLIMLIVCMWPLLYLSPEPMANKQEVVEIEFTKEKLEALVNAGKPVLVNVTAAWCLTCKVNERVIKSAQIQNNLRQKGITYLEADWTNQSDAISSFLSGFGRHGVPLYIYYPPNGSPRILPQILTESVVLEGIKE